LHKPAQGTTKQVYTFVTTQKWNKKWTDRDLYERYALTETEIAFVEKIVRPMDLTGDALGEVVPEIEDDE
jgi:site-specific DNA-methyltransferase (adenine-specific)